MDIGSNLEPKAWHGLLKTVAVEPAPVFALENCGEIRLFFDPKKFDVNVESVTAALNGLFYNNDCSGTDLDRLRNGEIRIFFNPACHGPSDSHRAINKVVEALCEEAELPLIETDFFLGDES